MSSFEALDRTLKRYGKDQTRAVFADTLIEDDSLYTFLADQESYFDIKIERVADGRTPFDIWMDVGVITARNGYAPCSEILKREQIIKWRRDNADTLGDHTLVFGMDWSEVARMQKLAKLYYPTPVSFPLAERPYLEKCDIAAKLDSLGIAIPTLYSDGFSHNNCGGGCVKAGQAHFALLLKKRPSTYAKWEAAEEAFCEKIGKTVSILADERGAGPRRPLPLREFRLMIERGERYNKLDWGGCGCFAPVEQHSMSDIMQATIELS